MKSVKMQNAFLVLEDGTVYNGYSMGAAGETIGEVVFNTCTASYIDLLSDPAYYGQIVAQTYPLVGNRGISNDEQLTTITANGYIAREWCETPFDIHNGLTLDEFLKEKNIVGISGLDTRQLTRKLRDKGYFKGAITSSIENIDNLISRIKAYSIHGAVANVTSKRFETFNCNQPKYNLVFIDYGFHRKIVKPFLDRHCRITIVPAYTEPDKIISLNPDGLVFPDGPGDPDDDPILIENISTLLHSKLPCFGYGLGHQMMALAAGGKIQKMAKGHRGSNQPVRLSGSDKVMITTQNHGYDILPGSLPEIDSTVTMYNVNDNSIEGIAYQSFNGTSTQFAPLEVGSFSDSAWIIDDFINKLSEASINV